MGAKNCIGNFYFLYALYILDNYCASTGVICGTQKIGYVFFDRPFHKPLFDTENLLKKLDNAVKNYGYIPLSLNYFYRIAGGVDLIRLYDTE